MHRQIFIGIMTEGTTDIRFLHSIVKRTFDSVAFDECRGDFENVVVPISINKAGLGFVEQVVEASRKGISENGIMILCVHSDADDENDIRVYTNKIRPAQIEISSKNEIEYCKVLTFVVPVQMIEAWMLADKDLLKREIGTDKTDNDLKINKRPEQIADPKQIIEQAIRIARQNLTQRRRNDLTISELYLPIGQKIAIRKLDALMSYQNFKENVREAFRQLGYM